VFAASILAVLGPFLSWGDFLIRKDTRKELRQRVANIKDIPPNSRITFPFPQTNNPQIDGDPFRQYGLIRLPTGELRAYSKVCVHLWCLWDYFSTEREIQCPCHGSVYNPDTGVAVRGPASFQPYPNNSLPQLKVEVDGNGDIFVSQLDGRMGYGREWKRLLSGLIELNGASPGQEVTGYVPFRRPLTVSEVESLTSRYSVRPTMLYGYRGQAKEREWLKAETIQQAQAEMEGVYAVDVLGIPGDLLRLADDKSVVVVMLRE